MNESCNLAVQIVDRVRCSDGVERVKSYEWKTRGKTRGDWGEGEGTLANYRTHGSLLRLIYSLLKSLSAGSPHVRESKKVLIYGFYAVNCGIPGTGFRTLCHWNLDQPNSNR